MTYTDWWPYVPLPTINGVFGLGYFPTYIDYTSFWHNMIAQGYDTTMAVSLLPSESDVSWIPNSANFTDTSSSVMIGDYNRSAYINTANNQTLTLTSADTDDWAFNATMGFGLTNTTEGLANATEFYTNMTYVTNTSGVMTYYNQVLFSTAYSGIGVSYV